MCATKGVTARMQVHVMITILRLRVYMRTCVIHQCLMFAPFIQGCRFEKLNAMICVRWQALHLRRLRCWSHVNVFIIRLVSAGAAVCCQHLWCNHMLSSSVTVVETEHESLL